MYIIKEKEIIKADSKLIDWIQAFTRSGKNSNSMRFEPPSFVLDELEIVEPNSYPIFRRTSTIRDPEFIICNVGDIIYEPLVSCSNKESFIDSFIKSEMYNGYTKGEDDSAELELKITIQKGAKSLGIDKYSAFKGQGEEIAAGMFKVVSKIIGSGDKITRKGTPSELVLKQVFSKTIHDIFKDRYKLKIKAPEVVLDYEEIIKKEWPIESKKTIAKVEIDRFAKKGINLTSEEQFKPFISRRVHQDYTYKIKGLTQEEFLSIVEKNKLKIISGRRFGIDDFIPIKW